MTSEYFARLSPFHMNSLSRRNARLLSCLAPQIGRQDTQRRRSHCVNPPSLPHRPRPRGFEFCAGLVGKSWHQAVIDPGEDQSLIATERVDVRGLAPEVDVVFGVDLEMNRD